MVACLVRCDKAKGDSFLFSIHLYMKRTQICGQSLVSSHLVIEVVERGFVFRKVAQVTFRKIPHPQLIPGKDRDSQTKRSVHNMLFGTRLSKIFKTLRVRRCFESPLNAINTKHGYVSSNCRIQEKSYIYCGEFKIC